MEGDVSLSPGPPPGTGPSSEAWRPARRDDIDGLRGCAVTAVVLFHAFPALLPGGFTGVDAFFVVSGFLITSIIDGEIDRGAFRFPAFWGRRVRRLFPALALVLGASLVAGWVLFSADELARLAEEVSAGAAFVANLLFASQRGYFQPSSVEKPLLHLWSLAIEEQFYLAWPVALWLLHRLRLPRTPVLGLLVAGSFAWNLSITGTQPNAAFYSTLARFWELGLGGLLATTLAAWGSPPAEAAPAASPPRRPWVRDLGSLAGVALLVAGLLVARPGGPYPGTTALLPTLGTALVIGAGPGALPNRLLLARRAIVALGLVSYPLYLWHWPLLSFGSILDGRLPAAGSRVALVALSLLLAWATWRFAEIPAREATLPRRTTGGLVAAVATLGLLGWSVAASGGALGFRAEPVARLAGDLGSDAFDRILRNYPQCTPRFTPPPTRPPAHWSQCRQSLPDRPPTVAILGDSHAAHLFPGLAEVLPEENVLCQARGDAPFATGPAFGWISRRLAAEPSLHTVVLSAFWGTTWRRPPAGQDFGEALRRTVETFTEKGKNVILFANTPGFRRKPRPCKYSGDDVACHPPASASLRTTQALRQAVAGNPRAMVIDPLPLLTDERGPSMERDGRVLFRDLDHLNAEGSRVVAVPIAGAIADLRRRPSR